MSLLARPVMQRCMLIGLLLATVGLLGALAARQTAAVEDTATIPAAADTYVRQVAQNANEGASPRLGVRALIDHHALVRFDQAEIADAVGASTLQSATLRMTLVENTGFWGFEGHGVAVHRLNVDWAEGNGAQLDVPLSEWTRGSGSGATWNCAADSNIANIFKNCSGPTEWAINDPAPAGPWQAAATDTETITTGQTGVIEWDVTADVQAFLDSAAVNSGWIVRRTDDNGLGDARFASREAGAGAPELVLTFVQAAPVAEDDSYDADINAGVQIAAPGVLANDLGSNLSAVPLVDAPTSAGGTVTLDADGSFSYDPPPGVDAGTTDSFMYTVENAAGSDSAEVTLHLIDEGGLGTIWFIDNSDTTPPFNGTFANPFNSLEQFNTSPLPDPGDTVFVYAGNAPYVGGIALQDGQTLLGEGAGLDAGPISIPAGDRPLITNASGDGISLAADNTVLGLDVGATTGAGLSGAAVGALQVGDVAINGPGVAVDLANGNVDVTLDEASASDVAAGISLTNLTGSVTINGGTLANNTNAVLLAGVTNVALSNLTISGSSGDAILGTNVTGLSLRDSSIDASGDADEEHGVDIANLLGASEIVNVTMSGAAASNIDVTNTAASAGGDTLTLSGLTLDEPAGAFGRDNIFIGAADAGALTVVMDASSALNTLRGGQDGIEAIALMGGALDVTVSGARIEASDGVGINLGALTGGAVTFDIAANHTASGGGIDAPDGIGINVANLFGGTMSGTITGNSVDDVAFGDGIRVALEGDGDSVVAIVDNDVTGNGEGSGIRAQARAGSGALDLTITDNVIDSDGPFSFDGVEVESGSSAGGDTNTLCLNLANNSSDVVSGEQGYRLRQRAGTAFLLDGFSGDGTQVADVAAWVNVDKGNLGTTDIVIGTTFGAGSCQTP